MRTTRRAMAAALFVGSLTAIAPDLTAAIEMRSDLRLLGQVRDGDQSRREEFPIVLYGDLGVSQFRHGITADTYFGLAHDFSRNEGLFTNFYSGSVRVPGAIPGVDFTLGRQILAETPDAIFVADAGKVRFDPGGPFTFTLFGGQPRYFEPLDGPERLSQDEQIWGGTIRTARLRNANLALGYFQQVREDRTLRQLVTASGTWSLSKLPGLPNFYGNVAYDADRQNLDRLTAGTQVFLLQPRLSANFEASYYKPQDFGDRIQSNWERREDPIFQVFSVSEMVQYRGGLNYAFSRALSAYADYSYQRYEKLAGDFENGHVGSVGIRWLPGGDGLEIVRAEYYTIDSSGGQVNGGRFGYESSVYQRILFRTTANVAYYEKENNQRDVTVATLLGIGYAILPEWVCEVNLEGNRNDRFDADIRVGFWITYNRRWRSQAAADEKHGGAS